MDYNCDSHATQKTNGIVGQDPCLPPTSKIMRQRIDALGRNIWLLRQVPTRIEKRTGIAALGRAAAQIMCQGILTGSRNVGIILNVPVRVEHWVRIFSLSSPAQ